MARIRLDQALPGMILSDDVYSIRGQLLANKNDILSWQMIYHLHFYHVAEIAIQKEADTPVISTEDPDSVPYETQSQRIRASAEYQEFRHSYEDKTSFFENSLNEFVKKQEPLEYEQLLSSTKSLFEKHSTTFGVLDMMHNMREIDDSTYAHSMNVSLISRVMGEWLNLSKEDLDILSLCGLLHDIGKSEVSNKIIEKPGKLTDLEFQEIQNHPRLGYELLKNEPINDHIKMAALMHHERCDGTGYPLGLTKEQIDPFAMIVSIADVYDAMTSDRCYRPGICPFDVIAEFQRNGLSAFHPQFVLIFLDRIANTYVNSDVLLNDGTTGKIVLIHTQELTRPLIQTSKDQFIDLTEHLDLYIKAIL